MTTAASHTTTGSGAQNNIAQVWWEAGVSVVPILAGGQKKPSMDWKILQSKPLSADQVRWYWRAGQRVGVAAICGKVSGNLELTELEADASSDLDLSAIRRECIARGIDHVWDSLLTDGYAEWTPSGGIHVMYRIPDHEIPGNTKLAMRLAREDELTRSEQVLREQNPHQKFWRTRAETRGEGGYVVVAPTPGFCHETGEAWVVFAGKLGVLPTITWPQRQALHAAIHAALDQTPEPEPAPPRKEVAVRVDGELRPGDDWETQHDWDEPWFTGQGWTISHRVGGETFWVRPGKDQREGHSASTGYRGDKDRLYVWSTSAGLPTEEPLTKFYVYAHYHYNGDLSRAAQGLRRMGYGSAPSAQISTELVPFEGDQRTEVDLPPQGGFDLTDTGSGRRMKYVYGDRFRYNTREKSWYEWTGKIWRRDESLAIYRAAVDCAERAVKMALDNLHEIELLGNSEEIKAAKKRYNDTSALKNRAKIESAITMFAAEPGIAITSDAFDQELSLLNLPNGTLDLVSGELMPHDPTNMITKTMAAEHDKDAECPLFRQFMVDAFPDGTVRDYVQRALGYTLLGTAHERALFLLHGPSGTGKSVLTKVMTTVFGSYGATAPASTFRIKKQSDTLDLHRLRGARFVATSEMPQGQQLDEDLVKRVSGGDMVSSRGHYEAFTEWKPNCVVWIATNFLPRVNSDDNAIWKRAKTILMDTEFGLGSAPDEIGNYAGVLAQEADGILNWLLEGLEAYRMRGLDQPDSVTEDIEAYRIDVNVTASFIRDKIEEGVLIKDETAQAKSHQLRAVFDQYCLENHYEKLGARRFQNQLKTLGFEPLKIGGQAYWRGLRVNLEFGVLGTMH